MTAFQSLFFDWKRENIDKKNNFLTNATISDGFYNFEKKIGEKKFSTCNFCLFCYSQV